MKVKTNDANMIAFLLFCMGKVFSNNTLEKFVEEFNEKWGTKIEVIK